MSLYSFYRISKPSEEKIASEKVEGEYKRLRGLTFWGVTGAYALYYVCRMAMSVVKQPLIDEGIFTAAQLGIIGSAISSMLSASSPTDSSLIIATCAVLWRPGF